LRIVNVSGVTLHSAERGLLRGGLDIVNADET
jgi:hypothetical protein